MNKICIYVRPNGTCSVREYRYICKGTCEEYAEEYKKFVAKVYCSECKHRVLLGTGTCKQSPLPPTPEYRVPGYRACSAVNENNNCFLFEWKNRKLKKKHGERK